MQSNRMKVEFDPDKRNMALKARGLDFARAGEVLDGAVTATAEDLRRDYGERRFVTVGLLDARVVVVTWTFRGDKTRIISMRKANEREIKKFAPKLG